ncbi:MAG: hypothetical protein KA785_07965 [Spirochaetaceae bacterium]|nr:hypothetical protein [Spirochaetaceae bacterium]
MSETVHTCRFAFPFSHLNILLQTYLVLLLFFACMPVSALIMTAYTISFMINDVKTIGPVNKK